MKAHYQNESAMYPEVARWLENFLRSRHPNSKVEAFLTPNERLFRVITRMNVERYLPPEWQTWDVQSDVVGFVQHENSIDIALIECKIAQISISHLSQAIGYSRIVRPRWSFLISPQGINPNLLRLLNTFNRQDVLVYAEAEHRTPRSLILARWDAASQQIDWSSVVPSGVL
jgi:hypothetical protein